MNDTPDVKIRKSRKKTALITAGIVITLGIAAAVTTISIRNHNAETARLCEVALTATSTAQTAVDTAFKGADDALDTSSDKAIRESLKGAAEYSKRSGSTELINAVTTAQTALSSVALKTICETRDDSDSLTLAAEAAAKPIAELNDAVTALNEDVALFIKQETKRIEAEKKAAAEAAARAEAEAQAAAEAEAEAQAAAQAAARAAEAAQQEQQWADPGYNDWTPPPSNDTYVPPNNTSPPPPPVDTWYNPDPCELDNSCIQNNI